MEIWKTIVIGKYDSVSKIRTALTEQEIVLNKQASNILDKIPFNFSLAEQEINLVRFSVKELGFRFSKGVIFAEIYFRALEMGLKFGTDDIAPTLRLDYKEQSKGEVIRVISDVSGGTFGNTFFRLENGFSGLYLYHYFISGENFFGPDEEFVCCI